MADDPIKAIHQDKVLKGMRFGKKRMSDDEKRQRGTWAPRYSSEAIEAKQQAKVLSGPWLQEIPPPNSPLNEVGQRAYDKFARLLFDQRKLTETTRALCENYAIFEQQKDAMLRAGKMPGATLINGLTRILNGLGISENAPTIAEHAQKISKFKRCGFSNRLPAQG